MQWSQEWVVTELAGSPLILSLQNYRKSERQQVGGVKGWWAKACFWGCEDLQHDGKKPMQDLWKFLAWNSVPLEPNMAVRWNLQLGPLGSLAFLSLGVETVLMRKNTIGPGLRLSQKTEGRLVGMHSSRVGLWPSIYSVWSLLSLSTQWKWRIVEYVKGKQNPSLS